MKVSDIMTDDVFTLSSDGTMAKALSIMYEKRINQIPVIDKYEKYQGMVFAKDFLNASAATSSKMKNFVVKTPVLSPMDSIKRSTQLIVSCMCRISSVRRKRRTIYTLCKCVNIWLVWYG
jgi:CBS-domain-containing membrane protein